MANGPFVPRNRERFEAACRRFDEENARDPNREDGSAQPRELLYAQWLSDWVRRLAPEASEELRLAARCQHLRRWEMPRTAYPATRAGYLKWRADLKQFHAREAAGILRAIGFPEDQIARVQALNLKQGFPADPESRVLEDALCLVFLERQLSPLAAKSPPDKMVNALRKAWKKMSPAGQATALTLSYAPAEKALVEQALAEEGAPAS